MTVGNLMAAGFLGGPEVLWRWSWKEYHHNFSGFGHHSEAHVAIW
jgi:hypothetical protein